MKIFTVSSDQTSAKFEAESNEFVSKIGFSGAVAKNKLAKIMHFTVNSNTASVSLSIAPYTLMREAQTERINRSMALGYMPELRKTDIR